MMAAGAAAALIPIQRREAWEDANRTVSIALDYDDTTEAAVRAGLPLPDLLHQLWHAGATHLALPEDTLGRLLAQGRVAPIIPRRPLGEPAPLGRWTYLAAHEPGLLARVQAELAARLPHLAARLLDDEGRLLLAWSGDLPAIQLVGLGFDADLAEMINAAGLQPLPQITSYPWPTASTIERSISQAAAIGGSSSAAEGPVVVAFQGIGDPGHVGELVLGHEMLLQETIAALRQNQVTLAYFAESRHQRGDWFVAKSLAPAVVLAHAFTPAELIVEDMHSAAHRWGLLAREKGIRLALLRLFKVVHATTPLDCVTYVAAVADVLVNHEGMTLTNRPDFSPHPVRHSHDHGHGHHHHRGERAARQGHEHAPDHDDHQHGPKHEHDHDHSHRYPHHRHVGDQHHHHDQDSAEVNEQAHGHDPEHAHSHGHEHAPSAFFLSHSSSRLPPLRRDDQLLPIVALIPAGAGALALSELLGLEELPATAITLAGLAAPLLLRQLDRPANALEASFRPSYAPKLLVLGTAALGPLAASLAGRNGLPGLAQALLIQAAAAAGLAASVAEHDYVLRIEEVRTGQLDWIAPLAGATAAAVFGGDAQTGRRLAATAGLGALGLAAARSGLLGRDPLAALDQEHTSEHTHHLSRAQAAIGDARMALNLRPLRKWTSLALLAQAAAALAPGRSGDLAAIIAAAGGVAFLAGFRQPARPVARTLAERIPVIGNPYSAVTDHRSPSADY